MAAAVFSDSGPSESEGPLSENTAAAINANDRARRPCRQALGDHHTDRLKAPFGGTTAFNNSVARR